MISSSVQIPQAGNPSSSAELITSTSAFHMETMTDSSSAGNAPSSNFFLPYGQRNPGSLQIMHLPSNVEGHLLSNFTAVQSDKALTAWNELAGNYYPQQLIDPRRRVGGGMGPEGRSPFFMQVPPESSAGAAPGDDQLCGVTTESGENIFYGDPYHQYVSYPATGLSQCTDLGVPMGHLHNPNHLQLVGNVISTMMTAEPQSEQQEVCYPFYSNFDG
ncbi:hypothetical protein AHF37_10534 [Paragonimus kellicotti]|nr:hypothetical protein AHF37_10534 [Paragonimus kellicotti]